MESNLTLWTRQEERVVAVLQAQEIYRVKRVYVDAKYQESSWSFQCAYGFFRGEMSKRLPPGQGEESPIWLHRTAAGTGFFSCGTLLELEVPVDQCVLMDGRKWNKILNLDYLATDAAEAESFQKKLAQQGIAHASLVFQKPYYPLLKQEIMQSWQTHFVVDKVPEEYLQAAVWHIKPQWVKRVIAAE